MIPEHNCSEEQDEWQEHNNPVSKNGVIAIYLLYHAKNGIHVILNTCSVHFPGVKLKKRLVSPGRLLMKHKKCKIKMQTY